MKFRVTYTDKEVVSITSAEGRGPGMAADDPTTDTILEDNVGQTLFAVVDAESETEAREKAQRLQTELQTRRTKRDLEGSGDGPR
jgi:hypothetical protein